jgi:hypothetical protein
MITLLLAAAVATIHPGQPSDPGGLLNAPVPQPIAPACAKLETQTVAPNGTPFRKLNELPPAVIEHAVWRMVSGCPVREVVWQGQTYYVGSSDAVLVGGPLPGARIQRRDSH